VGVVTFLGRTVNLEDGLRTSIDESSFFECLNAIIRPSAVVFAGVIAVEKRSVDGGTTRKIVQVRRQGQQHSPDLHLKPVKGLNQHRMIKEIAHFEAGLGENMWHFA